MCATEYPAPGEGVYIPRLPTPHIRARAGDVAPVCLFPGDPLRAQFIAETFFKDAVLVNNVRGINTWTGTVDGKRISVSASGMGASSASIYAYELFTACGVQRLIRVGSCGSLQSGVRLRDLVIAVTASYSERMLDHYKLGCTFAPVASARLLRSAMAHAAAFGSPVHIGGVLTDLHFYNDSFSPLELRRMGTLCVEMETAVLYATANRLGKDALSILTVSDIVGADEQCTAEERQLTFKDMIALAIKVGLDED